MSEILDAIGTALENAGVGTLGSTLFLSRQPPSPDAMVTVYETGAGYAIYTFGGAPGPRLSVSNIQVVARASREDYPAARTALATAVDALEALSESTIDGIRILRAEQIGSASPLGLDDNDRPRIAQTLSVTYD